MAQLKDELKTELTTSLFNAMRLYLAPGHIGMDVQVVNSTSNPLLMGIRIPQKH